MFSQNKKPIKEKLEFLEQGKMLNKDENMSQYLHNLEREERLPLHFYFWGFYLQGYPVAGLELNMLPRNGRRYVEGFITYCFKY